MHIVAFKLYLFARITHHRIRSLLDGIFRTASNRAAFFDDGRTPCCRCRGVEEKDFRKKQLDLAREKCSDWHLVLPRETLIAMYVRTAAAATAGADLGGWVGWWCLSLLLLQTKFTRRFFFLNFWIWCELNEYRCRQAAWYVDDVKPYKKSLLWADGKSKKVFLLNIDLRLCVERRRVIEI